MQIYIYVNVMNKMQFTKKPFVLCMNVITILRGS